MMTTAKEVRTMTEINLRGAVWQAMLDAERYGRYYGYRAETHRRWYVGLRYGLMFAAVGGVTSIVGILPDNWQPVIAAVTGVVVVALVTWDFMSEDGKKAAILHAICIECGEFDLRLRAIWTDVVRLDEDEELRKAWAEVRAIEESMLRMTARAGYAGVREDDAENKRATEEAYKVVVDRMTLEEEAHA